ncbi:GPN-loop GTPase 3-like isoform X2 [Cucurbita maxima]|uniref:GPN-loop GTPase 3 n=1 Tax=Cucurbita maxima TaxID=3661 RepID=A0A6J1KXB8_CUCMA|nr:GPN-loop GTPase 3-like isoform X2 [Cucurbita maxima]
MYQFMTDITKFISGCMASLSAMVQLELPHINILSKMYLVTNKKDIEDFLNPEPQVLLSELNQRMAPQFSKLNKALIELVDEYNTVSFVPLDLRKESSSIVLRINDRKYNNTTGSSYSFLLAFILWLRDVAVHLNWFYCCIDLSLKAKPDMISFVLNSIRYVLAQIDICIQYGEDADVKIKDMDPEDDD